MMGGAFLDEKDVDIESGGATTATCRMRQGLAHMQSEAFTLRLPVEG